MSVITEHENQQVNTANATGKTPVVFVHGLWLLPSSWDRWREHFGKAGYATLAPGWPDDPETVAEAKQHPEVFAKKSVGQVADHFGKVIGKLSKKPAEVKVDTKNPDRGPLLILDGELDHTVPWSIANASYNRQKRNPGVTEIAKVPGRGHALTIDSGWQEVADLSLTFVQRYVQP